jgi:hypothetical protein
MTKDMTKDHDQTDLRRLEGFEMTTLIEGLRVRGMASELNGFKT